MVLGEDMLKEIENEIGIVKTEKAKKFCENKNVKIEKIDISYDYTMIMLNGQVQDHTGKINRVYIRLSFETGEFLYGHNCSCKPYSYQLCEHILAVLLEFNNNPKYYKKIQEEIEKEYKEQEKRMFSSVIERFEEEQSGYFNDLVDLDESANVGLLNSNIDIIPVIKKNRNSEYILSFKIGENKMYKLKDFEIFYKNYSEKNVYKYGDNLIFKHEEESFSKNSKEFLQFILKYGQAIYYGNRVLENKNAYGFSKVPSSSLMLKEQVVDDFFEILKNKKYDIEFNDKKSSLNFLGKEGNIQFNLEETAKESYRLSISKKDCVILTGLKKVYAIDNNNVYEYDKKEYKDFFKLISIFEIKDKSEFNFEKEELLSFINNVLPKVKDKVSFINISNEVKEKYIPKKLGVKVYLDLTDNGDVLATMNYCYDDIEFEPFSNKIPTIPRNIFEEKRVEQRFLLDGFEYNNNYGSYLMKNEEKIYNFITNSIHYYMENYEVLISDEFKKREVRQPKIASLGVKVQNNLLNIELSGLDFNIDELKGILQKYKLKKKYYRLKNGEFLSLEQNKALDFFDNLTEGLEVDYNSLSKGRIKIPVNRSLYLNKLLNNMENVDINKDKQFKEIVLNTENSKMDEEIEIPEELEITLRTYQKTGYKWLKVLDKYRFGGILADDMGLRKNIASNISNIKK